MLSSKLFLDYFDVVDFLHFMDGSSFKSNTKIKHLLSIEWNQ